MIKTVVKLLLAVAILFPANSYGATVNVAVPSFSMSLVAFMAAKDRGYYRQEGLDVNFVLMPAAIASRALIAGNVDFATVGGSALTASLGGAPLRMIFSSFNRSLFSLYSRPEIADVKELRGKKVGVSSIGSGPDCDGQILVTHDLIGTFPWFTPRFVKPRLNAATQMRDAITAWKSSLGTPSPEIS